MHDTTSTAKTNDTWDYWINLLAAKWEEYLILLTKEIIIENVRYQPRVDDKRLAEGIARIGRDAKALDPDPTKHGNEFVVKWPGRFTITAYPKRGYIQWIPKGTQVDAVLAFLTFLCGGELIPKRFEREFALINPPIARLGYSREDALKILANMELVHVGLEHFILSDPYEQLPIGAKVSQEHPPLKHLPGGKATIEINGSHDQNGSRTTKDIQYSGHPLETILLHAANHEGALFVDFVRQYIDHVMGIEDQVSNLETETRNSSAQIQLTVNDTTDRVEQLQDAERRFNNDLTHVMTIQLPELGRKLDDLLRQQPHPGQPAQVDFTPITPILEAIRDNLMANGVDAREENRFLAQELDEQLRGISANITENTDLLKHHHKDSVLRDNARAIQVERVVQALERYHRGVIHNEQVVARKMSEMEADIALEHAFLENVNHELKKHSRWIRKEQLDYYAATLAILKRVPDITAKHLAAMLDVKRTRVYEWMKKLANFTGVEHEKRVPDPEPQGEMNSSGAGSALEVHPAPSPETEPVKSKPTKRRVLHFFLRVIGKEANPKSNEQIKPEDEKT